MDAVTSTTVSNASAANPATPQGVAAVVVLRKALDLEASAVARLIESLPQPPLATSGPLGTQLNTYA